ncbi:S-locus-specific glycoprotein S6-like [Setaria italica]|uniref:S-locus-specific glycoprotein S6-like n=1 Tax=Setaria italica TaxID=4555 RepID=UPI000BE4E80F|nr:S-locus-specific glycoprotein S6-like [Setaria italica]
MDMANLHVFFLLFLILSSFCESKSNDRLTQATSLSPGNMLISEGRVFALGFFSPTNSSRSLYLGIWYHNIPDPERTVVWVANRDSPISNSSLVKLTVTNTSELVLFDSDGRTVWMTANTTTTGGPGAVAVLLDTGNFVLRLLNGTDIWQSMDHPTDTILPNTRILLSYKAQVFGRLVAWKGPDDPSSGDFSVGMDPSSNLQIFIWKGSLPYKRPEVINEVSVSGGTYQSNTTSVMSQLLYYRGDGFYFSYTVSDGSPYTRILLDYRGNLSLLSWNNTTLSWTLASYSPRGCDLYASCGPFGYCDMTAAPTCRCPDGFELLDSLNFSRGCKRKEALRCGKENYFTTMPNMKVPDKFLHIRNRSLDECASECTRNCSCVAYAYANLSNDGITGDTSRCLVWTGDLIDMEKASFAENLYIRLGESPGMHVPVHLILISFP